MRQDTVRIIHIIITILLMSVVLSSCEGMFSGIYDDPISEDDDKGQENIYGFTSYDSVSKRGTMYLKLTEYDKWTYISFHDRSITQIDIPKELTGEWDGKSAVHYNHINGSVFTLDSIIKTDAQKEPDKWDIALHRYEARTTNGAIETSYTSLDELPVSSSAFEESDYVQDEWIDTLVMTDISNMFAYYIGYQNIRCNKVLSSWLAMDISNPPPVYIPSNKVYIVRLSDGTKVAMHFDNYMTMSGTKGYVSVSFIYPY